MGSYPRREKAEQKARERADKVPALQCQSCSALTPGDRCRYYADKIVCETCGKRNPQSRRILVGRSWLSPRNICVNIIGRDGYTVQAMDTDNRTPIGPFVRVQRAETLRRLLAYLGATPEQLAAYDDCQRRGGQGTIQITLQPRRENLLHIDYSRL